jgi:hypothetical protein
VASPWPWVPQVELSPALQAPALPPSLVLPSFKETTMHAFISNISRN